MTGNVHLTDLIRTMLESRRFFVVLNGKKSRWWRQRNGLSQGSVLAPMLFNIYTNDQPIHADTRRVIYADDLCIASQGNDFNNIEASLTSALSTMTTYYDTNQLRANHSKTHVCASHIRNREAKRELNVMWNKHNNRLSNTTTPVDLHTRVSWTRPYTTAAESSRTASNQWTWTVYTYTGRYHQEDVVIACRMERTRQTTDARHQLFQLAASRLKSRKSMRTVTSLNSSASSSRLQLWKDSPTDVSASVKMGPVGGLRLRGATDDGTLS